MCTLCNEGIKGEPRGLPQQMVSWRNYTEKEVLERVMREGKVLSLGHAKRTRDFISRKAKNWTTKRYDAWLATQIEQGVVTTKVKSLEVSTMEGRKELKKVAEQGVPGWKAKITRKVRRWVRRRAGTEQPKVTTAMVREMNDNLKQEGGPEVSAAQLLGAIAGEWEVEDMRTHPGGTQQKNRDIVQELVACTEESVVRGMANGTGQAGVRAGRKRSKFATTSVKAVLDGLKEAKKAIPSLQYCLEQPRDSALKDLPRVKRQLGTGVVVPACPYGRKSSKEYRLWLAPETEAVFQPLTRTEERSLCQACKEGHLHEQAHAPKPGDKRKRIHEEGHTGAAARNRIPWRLSKQVGEDMLQAWEGF